MSSEESYVPAPLEYGFGAVYERTCTAASMTLSVEAIGTEAKAAPASNGRIVAPEVRLYENHCISGRNASLADLKVTVVHAVGFRGRLRDGASRQHSRERREHHPDTNGTGQHPQERALHQLSIEQRTVAKTIPANDNTVQFALNPDAGACEGDSISLRVVVGHSAPADGTSLMATGETVAAEGGDDNRGDNSQTIMFAAGETGAKTAEFTIAEDADTDDKSIIVTLTSTGLGARGGLGPRVTHTISVLAPRYGIGCIDRERVQEWGNQSTNVNLVIPFEPGHRKNKGQPLIAGFLKIPGTTEQPIDSQELLRWKNNGHGRSGELASHRLGR